MNTFFWRTAAGLTEKSFISVKTACTPVYSISKLIYFIRHSTYKKILFQYSLLLRIKLLNFFNEHFILKFLVFFLFMQPQIIFELSQKFDTSKLCLNSQYFYIFKNKLGPSKFQKHWVSWVIWEAYEPYRVWNQWSPSNVFICSVINKLVWLFF